MTSLNKGFVFGVIGVVIFTIPILFSLIYPPSKKHYNPSGNLHTHEACIGLGVPVFPTPSDDKKHPESKKQSDTEQWCADRSDLAAQWKTSDLTNTAFWAGCLGIWLIGWTLIATRQATEITKEANMRSQRAYLAVTKIQTMAERKNFPVTIAVVIKNVGMTPAHNIKIGRIFEIEDSDGVLLGVPRAKSGNWGSLGPQITKTAEMDITNTDILSGIVAGPVSYTHLTLPTILLV